MAQTDERRWKRPPDEAADYELSVGDVMTDEYVAVREDTTVEAAIDRFREYAPDDPEQTTIYYVYVLDDEDRLIGVVSLRELLHAAGELPISEVMAEDPLAFDEDADAEPAAMQMADLHYPAVPIVDDDGRMVGLVRSDVLVEVVEEESTEDFLRMQGMDLPDLEPGDLTEIETRRSSIMLDAPIQAILRIRIPWLVVALAGGFLAGGVIGVYEGALEQVVMLAFFIPVVMDMGGNVGTQSSTIFVRGVVLGHIERANVAKRILKEALVGVLIGLIVGVIAGAIAWAWQGQPEIGYVVFGAMVGVSFVAALVGFAIPWLLYLAGQDPAAASNPIITTIKDVSGLLIYFSLALLIMDIPV